MYYVVATLNVLQNKVRVKYLKLKVNRMCWIDWLYLIVFRLISDWSMANAFCRLLEILNC